LGLLLQFCLEAFLPLLFCSLADLVLLLATGFLGACLGFGCAAVVVRVTVAPGQEIRDWLFLLVKPNFRVGLILKDLSNPARLLEVELWTFTGFDMIQRIPCLPIISNQMTGAAGLFFFESPPEGAAKALRRTEVSDFAALSLFLAGVEVWDAILTQTSPESSSISSSSVASLVIALTC
jgi:hypothetical protein